MSINGETKLIEMGIRTLIHTQLELRKKIDGENATSNKIAVRTISFALITEITELANELGWKPWRGSEAPSVDRILDEFADVAAYFGTLAGVVMDRCGVGPEELAEAYSRKLRINLDRFAGNVGDFAPIIPTNEEQTPIIPTNEEQTPINGRS